MAIGRILLVHEDKVKLFLDEVGAGHLDADGIAQAIDLAAAATEGFKTLPGNGLEALLDGKKLCGGSRAYIETVVAGDSPLFETGDTLAAQGKTPLYFAADGRLLGLIAVADVIKESSPAAVSALRKLGLRVLMLTGDNEKTAKAIGALAGVSDVVAGVLPDRKEAEVRRLQQSGRVAMVGDGINDAPALTRADVGIAIGAGTDVAIDSADIVLMNSDLQDVAACVRLGRGTLRNIHENLFWAFFYNVICIPLAAGLFAWKLNPMIAAAAMSLSSVTVCLNALRLNLLKIKDDRRDRPRRTRKKAAPVIQPQAAAGERVTLGVKGMMCEHCEATVKKALEELPFVAAATADHTAGKVTVELQGAFDLAAVKQAIKAKGYTCTGVNG